VKDLFHLAYYDIVQAKKAARKTGGKAEESSESEDDNVEDKTSGKASVSVRLYTTARTLAVVQ
jgi:hypothetical protein